MKRRRRRALGIITVLLAAASPAGSGVMGETIRIEMKGLAFTPGGNHGPDRRHDRVGEH